MWHVVHEILWTTGLLVWIAAAVVLVLLATVLSGRLLRRRVLRPLGITVTRGADRGLEFDRSHEVRIVRPHGPVLATGTHWTSSHLGRAGDINRGRERLATLILIGRGGFGFTASFATTRHDPDDAELLRPTTTGQSGSSTGPHGIAIHAKSTRRSHDDCP